MSAEEPKGFKKAKSKSAELLENKEKLKKLLFSAKQKAKKKKGQLGKTWKDLQTLFRLLKAWKNKRYKHVPWRTILYATSAILYFVMPFDVIPDFIPISGFIDDVAILTFVINSIQEDLEKFKKWEEQEKEQSDE